MGRAVLSPELVLKAAIYARVSTSEQSTEPQARQLEEWARAQGYEVVERYLCTESGAKTERASLAAVLEHARRRKWDVLLFWSLDRLSREGTARTLSTLTQLADCGAEFRSYREPYLDSLGPFRDAVIGLLAAIANTERARISERTKAGLEAARKKGKHIGRPPRVLDAEKARALRAGGLSLRATARRLGVSHSTLRRRL